MKVSIIGFPLILTDKGDTFTLHNVFTTLEEAQANISAISRWKVHDTYLDERYKNRTHYYLVYWMPRKYK